MSISSVGSAAQEALETAAQTRAEAAKGDQQAVRRIAKLNVAPAQQAVAPAVDATTASAPASPAPEAVASVPPDSTGAVLNVKA